MKKFKIKHLVIALAVLMTASVLPAQNGTTLTVKAASFDKQVNVIATKQTQKAKTEKEKLKALFRYVEKNYNYKRVVGFKDSKGWTNKYAKETLAAKAGSCYHFAAFYGTLAKKVSKSPVRVCIGKTNGFNKAVWQPHAWCEIKIKGSWYVCDANLDKYAAQSKGTYFMKKYNSLKIYKREKSFNI